MDEHPDNPASNTIPQGVTEAAIQSGIESSGYPLQLVVAQELSRDFQLHEEWGFVDSDSGTTRTIDLVATKSLFEWTEPQPRIRPALNLVIECKQSALPYVFFLSGTTPWIKDFPVVSGLANNAITLKTDDDRSSWTFCPVSVFDLRGDPFLRDAAPSCMTFSKCVRKGSDIVLSGSEPYQNVVFPITKAVCHFQATQSPPKTAHYFDCGLVVGMAVLDAPMIGVRLTDSGSESVLLPWVRVVRHRPSLNPHKHDDAQVHAIEVVHKDYLRTYLDFHLNPFAQRFADLALKHPDVLADGKGFVSGMGQNSWTQIEPRLRRKR
jgi:hypothetical protein